MTKGQSPFRVFQYVCICSLMCITILFSLAAYAQVVTPADDADADAPPPSGWGFHGNSSDGSAMDGEGDPWLGTSDETDMVLKAFGQERLRLRAQGNTVVSDTLITDNLRVLGTTAMDSMRSMHIRANRITSYIPGDSLIRIGDNSIIINHTTDHIYALQHGGVSNLLLQCQPLPVYGEIGTNHTILNSVRGNVGIGTGSPSAKLHVVGGGSHALRVFSDGKVRVGHLSYAPARLYLGDDHQYIGSALGQGLNLSTWQAENALVIRETSGNVGIGLTNPAHKLDVCGTIRSKEWIVELAGCDFVFEENYELPEFSDRMDEIRDNKRLPYMLSANEMQTDGAPMGDSFLGLLRNLEELYLYVGQLEERLKAAEKQNGELRSLLERVKTLEVNSRR